MGPPPGFGMPPPGPVEPVISVFVGKIAMGISDESLKSLFVVRAFAFAPNPVGLN